MDGTAFPPGVPRATLWPAEAPLIWLARLAHRLRLQDPPLPMVRQPHADGTETLITWLLIPGADLVIVHLHPSGAAIQLNVWSCAWWETPHRMGAEYRWLIQRVTDCLLDQICLPTDPYVRLQLSMAADRE